MSSLEEELLADAAEDARAVAYIQEHLPEELKEKFPLKKTWLYTGYCWNEIVADDSMSEIIKYVDVICDGPFVESLKDVNLHWVGSSNQHVIDVKERLQKIVDIASETNLR